MRSAFYQRIWQEAAASTGSRIEDLGHDILRIRRGRHVTRVWQNYVSLDDCVTLLLAGNKPVSYRILAECGVRIPAYTSFTLDTASEAYAFLESRQSPCVVKPASNTGGGLGVTTGISSRKQLRQAAALAAAFGKDLLIQEQIPGRCYRLLYLDGVLLDAVVQAPPRVTGDGVHSVASLVQRLNEDRLANGPALGQNLVTVDLDMRQTLRAQGLTLSSVPPAGQSVVLKTVVNENAGADNRTASGDLCASVIREGARAARAVGARLAGVDVVTQDAALPLAESGGAVIEVNTTPGFYWHYHKADGICQVARRVLEVLFSDPEHAPPADAAAPLFDRPANMEAIPR